MSAHLVNTIPPFEGYVFDLDGTIYLGEQLLPSAGQTIARLRSWGRRVIFLSNNPTHTCEQYAAKLSRLGLPTQPQDIVNSSQVMMQWLLETAPGCRVFVVGEQPLMQELTQAGFQLVEQADRIDFVIASFDRTFHYQKLQISFDAIRAGARFVATNADRYCPVPGGGQPDAASVIAAIEACTGTTVEVVVGKPSPIMARTVAHMLKLPAERCIMVGDRLETDIAMGKAAGMVTAVVLTGATTRALLNNSPIQPDYILENIGQLIDDQPVDS